MNAVPRRPLHKWFRRHRLVLFVIIALAMVATVQAQNTPPPLPDTAVPRRPVYGIGLDEFWIAAVKAVIPHNQRFDSLWNFAREMNISTWELRNVNFLEIDSLRDAADSTQRLILDNEPMKIAAYGKEVTFFPYDSADNYYYRNVFVDHAAGTQFFNAAAGDSVNQAPQERVYDPNEGTTANQVVASKIAYGYDASYNVRRYPLNNHDPQFQHSETIFDHTVSWLNSNKFSIEIAAHLFDPLRDGGGGATGPDTLLFIDIWNEAPMGAEYRLTPGGAKHTAQVDTEFIYTTIGFTKAQLNPIIPPLPQVPNFNQHRILTALNINFDTLNGRCGPHHPSNTAHRMDLRVRWGGLEKVALHRVTLRDSSGQLANGRDADAIRYRDSLLFYARRLVHGPSGTGDSTRVIRFYGGDEGGYLQHKGFRTLDTVVRAAFPWGDSLTRGVRAYRAQSGHDNPITHMDDEQGEITVETYYKDITNAIVDRPDTYFGLDSLYIQPGAIRAHAGGRNHVPLIDTTASDVAGFERAFQRIYLGGYTTDPEPWPYAGTWADALGNGAWSSRRTGKRLIHWMGVHSAMNLIWSRDPATGVWYRDPKVAKISEPAELRMMANLGLAYGSRGVEYSWIGTTLHDYNEQDGLSGDTNFPRTWQPYKFYSDIGPVGDYDSLRTDFFSELVVHTDHPFPFPFDTTPGRTAVIYDTLRNFWTGWGIRSAELKWLGNSWLPRIGRAMAKLQWRDGYSAHFFQQQSWLQPNISGETVPRRRELPWGEIVQSVTARSLAGVADAPEETFVELGFFDRRTEYDTLPGEIISKQVHYIYVTNRRVFERPADVDSTSAEGRWMDAHAENRMISLKLNLTHHDGLPAGDHYYKFVRVTQVIDSMPLAGRSDIPHALDTLVDVDSTITFALRPGGGTLLRIAYCPPELAIGPGNLERNGQRKLLFDGTRYYACWTGERTCRFPLNLPNNQRHPVTSDVVYFRRSYPVTDSTGAIQWEPQELEYVVSDTTNEQRFRDNRYPSMTLRRIGGDSTLVTVVWTGYNTDSATPGRIVYLRNILSTSGTIGAVGFGGFEKPGFVHGWRDSAYGTPVVSRLHGGYMIGWSDSLHGILARFRRTTTNWNGTGAYSQRTDSVSMAMNRRFSAVLRAGVGLFPSMPPFADLGAEDSNVAIVWQQPYFNGQLSIICYARIIDTVALGVHLPVSRNYLLLSTESPDGAFNPSIDQSLDVWHRIQEGVVWDEPVLVHEFNGGVTRWYDVVNFRSLWTANGNHPGDHDSLGRTYLWGLSKWIMRLGAQTESRSGQFLYPTASALNQVLDTVHMDDSLFFTVVMGDGHPPYRVSNAFIRYSSIRFSDRHAGRYAFGGSAPNGVASDTRIEHRFAAIYQAPRVPDSVRFTTMHTTRQYYGKTRPIGYMAEGRQGVIRLSDTAFAALAVQLFDVWKSGPSSAYGVAMGPVMESTPWMVDSLDGLRGMMRTAAFTAHDSTTIGLSLRGQFYGDTTGRAALQLRVVAELVDSAATAPIALDSFTVTSQSGIYTQSITRDLDLLSGSYYVRLRIDTVAAALDTLTYYTNYTVASLVGEVEDSLFAKVRRVDRRGAASQGRISAWPNPIPGMAELRFSVPTTGRVTLTMYDQEGRERGRLIDDEMMEEGRYAVDLDAAGLPSGAYILELRYGAYRTMEKVVVLR